MPANLISPPARVAPSIRRDSDLFGPFSRASSDSLRYNPDSEKVRKNN
jgi:hypothetical protein